MNNGAPYYYDYINAQYSQVSPSTIHVSNTLLRNFFTKYLLQKAISVFDWTLPEGWAENYLKYVLYCWGYIGIVETDRFGVIPQACGLQGYNVMYQPTHIIINNPLIDGTMRPQIDRDCVLLKLQPDYSGIMDLVGFYADMMAMCAETAGTNLFNSKLSYIFASENKTTAESFKKLYDKIMSGDPAGFVDKNLFRDDGSPNWMTFAQNLKQNYIAGDILDDMRKWECKFDTEIGIPNSNTEKKERMIVDEVNSNNVEVQSRSDMWLKELKRQCEKARRMFGIDLDVDWRKGPEQLPVDDQGGDQDGSE